MDKLGDLSLSPPPSTNSQDHLDSFASSYQHEGSAQRAAQPSSNRDFAKESKRESFRMARAIGIYLSFAPAGTRSLSVIPTKGAMTGRVRAYLCGKNRQQMLAKPIAKLPCALLLSDNKEGRGEL